MYESLDPAARPIPCSHGSGTARKAVLRAFDRESSFRKLRVLILGAQLAELRRQRRMTRRAISDHMDVSQAHITRIEHGEARDVEQVRDYVSALGSTMVAIPEGPGYAVTIP